MIGVVTFSCTHHAMKTPTTQSSSYYAVFYELSVVVFCSAVSQLPAQHKELLLPYT